MLLICGLEASQLSRADQPSLSEAVQNWGGEGFAIHASVIKAHTNRAHGGLDTGALVNLTGSSSHQQHGGDHHTGHPQRLDEQKHERPPASPCQLSE